ncbi:MAG: hypothetical protein IPK16_23740 [Anaerolineales bacterium]|nr:hypothetical protein [Anaerolineales bacterium]
MLTGSVGHASAPFVSAPNVLQTARPWHSTHFGILAAILKGHDLQTAVEWGAAHGILVQETPGDTTTIDERAVLSEVKRVHANEGVKAQR